MYGIEEVLQLRREWGRSQREIGRACWLSAGTVNQSQLRESLPEPSRASLSAARFSIVGARNDPFPERKTGRSRALPPPALPSETFDIRTTRRFQRNARER